MTQLSEADKQVLVLWNVVVDALLNNIQHHREQTLIGFSARDVPLGNHHIGAMRHVAATLAMFLSPPDA